MPSARPSRPRLQTSRVDGGVSSYMPMGTTSNGLPLGKYYPSNYEQRTGSPSPYARGVASDSVVPQYKGRADADPRRLMEQYQRDMMAQASMGVRAILSNRRGAGAGATSGLPAQATAGMASVKAAIHPISPQLLPLGSPGGHMTPMLLEGGDGYLGAGYINAGRVGGGRLSAAEAGDARQDRSAPPEQRAGNTEGLR